MSNIPKPSPRINAINQPFFDGCNQRQLILQRCTAPDCGRYVYFPRVCCPYCGSGNLEWHKASGRGTVVSFTIVHRPNHPSFFPEAPYIFAAIRLAEGPIMYSRLEEPLEPDVDFIGCEVEATFEPLTERQLLPHFRRRAPQPTPPACVGK